MVDTADWRTFLAAGASSKPNLIDSSCCSSHVVYGCQSAIALINFTNDPVSHSLVQLTRSGHESDLTCLRWAKHDTTVAHSSHQVVLISGSTDRRVCLWSLSDGHLALRKIVGQFRGSVVCVSAVHVPDSNQLLACVGVDEAQLFVYNIDSKSFEVESEASLTDEHPCSAVPLCCDALSVANEQFLAIGYDNFQVRLFLRTDKFEYNFVTLFGHVDWIRSVDLCVDNNNLYVASCSQDCHIRVWKSCLDEKSDEPAVDVAPEIRLKAMQLSAYNICLETVLTSHVAWVYSVRWSPAGGENLRLLSASMDKSIIMWKPSPDSIWNESARVGNIGGNPLGYYGACFAGSDGMIGLSFAGGLHYFRRCEDTWFADTSVTGHIQSVECLGWDVRGQYLLSGSFDRTVRLWAPWIRSNEDSRYERVSYHELARCQVHGLDVQCLASVSPSCFISGAEEKVLRVFSATEAFVENFARLTSQSPDDLSTKLRLSQQPPLGASMPALGLSNKAVHQSDLTDQANGDDAPLYYFYYTQLVCPPTDDYLTQNTLWPEVQKLYGHGYELYAICANRAGTLVASACKSAKKEHAALIVWSTATWTILTRISGHSLTVTDCAFSPDDLLLLSVSRDRTWCLYDMAEPTAPRLVAQTDKQTGMHTRIIWACAWSHDNRFFATAARDKKVVVWSAEMLLKQGGTVKECVSGSMEFDSAATAIDFAPICLFSQWYILCVGLESGSIHLLLWNRTTHEFRTFVEWSSKAPPSRRHATMVKRVRFRPCLGTMEGCAKADFDRADIVQLATCGEDCTLQIIDIPLKAATLVIESVIVST